MAHSDTQMQTRMDQPQWFAPVTSIGNINLTIPATSFTGGRPFFQQGMGLINGSQLANISVHMPTLKDVHQQRSMLTADTSFNTHDQVLVNVLRTREIHDQIDGYMNALMERGDLSMDQDILNKINQVAHQVVADLLRGNMAMIVGPNDLHMLFDHIRDYAVMHVNGLKDAYDFCPEKLKHAIMNHPKVRSFKEKHDPRHGHWSNMRYHPDTGIPSNTVIATHLEHFLPHFESYHGHAGHGSMVYGEHHHH